MDGAADAVDVYLAFFGEMDDARIGKVLSCTTGVDVDVESLKTILISAVRVCCCPCWQP